MRADWIDVDCSGEGLRELDGICEGDECAPARDGEADGCGRGDQSGGGRRGEKDSGGDGRNGCRCAPGDERSAERDSAGIQGAAGGRAGFTVGNTDGECATGSGERRDFQGRHGAGNLWAANVSDLGADDGAAEGRAVEPGAAVWREDFAG